MKARWIDLGECSPEQYHASYLAVAECMRPDDDPVLVWGQPAAHFCLGVHQTAALELVADAGVPVLRRPLGGGGVWIDRQQVCLVMVAPRQWFPSRPHDWYAHALAPMLDVYAGMGWPVQQVGSDIRLAGRKLAGSGAATIGAAALVGSSFLLDFPQSTFASLVSAPSSAFRDWLADALTSQMTCWAAQATPPAIDWLSLVYRRAASQHFGWRWEQALLSEPERDASEQLVEELQPHETVSVRRTVPHGIKIRGGCYLTERHFPDGGVRILAIDGRLARVWLQQLPDLAGNALADVLPVAPDIAARLSEIGAGEIADRLADMILQTAWLGDDAEYQVMNND